MIETILAYTILVLGLINAFRMTSYFILADIYDLLMTKADIKAKRKKTSYTPKVSVVVAAYNEEKNIERTLKSIFTSTYKNLEVCVVDDGSKDKTSVIVKKFIKKNPNFDLVLVKQKNAGKAHALNNGIKNHTRGNLIMSLDADSTLSPDAITNATKYFRDRKIVALASNVRIIPNNTVLGAIQTIEYLLGHRLKKAYTVLNNEYIIGGIGSMFRKSILKKVNFYDTDTITEDIDLTMKILANGNKKNKVIFGSNVLCFTEPVNTLSDLYKQRYRWKYGRFQTLLKNKKMFFNTENKYSKLLTILQLPFVIYSELAFFIDPLLIGFLIYLSVKYKEVASLQSVFGFLAFYVFITIMADEYLTLKEKLQHFILAPLSYSFFLVVSVVEYVGLINSLLNYKGIIHATTINKCGWEHVARA